MRPRWGSTPRRTDRLIVGRNVTLTLTLGSEGEAGTENTRGLNLAAVRHTTVQVTMVPL
jgi:hypothetical protein